MKYLILFLLIVNTKIYADMAYEQYIENDPSYLDSEDQRLLQKLNDNKRSNGFVPSDFQVHFTYGLSTPTIVCAILELTDIELEPNESVLNIQIGDSTRWSVDVIKSGNGQNDNIEHVIIKPLDIALSTSLIISTDQRVYRLKLKSNAKEYMPAVKFIYPQKELEKINEQRKIEQKQKELDVIESTNININDLDFNYKSQGDSSVCPSRIYNDGSKTILEFDKGLLKSNAPIFVALKDDSFLSEKNAIVNYRIVKNKYIIDGIFNRGKLISNKNFKTNECQIYYVK